MNTPTLTALNALLVAAGTSSTMLGGASIGLIGAPFTPSKNLTLAGITECNFDGYARKSIGNPSVPFTGSDGLQYVEGLTNSWMPSDTITPNQVFGSFLTFGNSTTTLFSSDALTTPINLPGPGYQITITPRIALDPAGNFGLNVVSS